MRYFLLLASVFLFLACSASRHIHASNDYDANQSYEQAAADAAEVAGFGGWAEDGGLMGGSSGGIRARGSMAMKAAPASAPAPTILYDSPPQDEAERPREQRMVNYNGEIHLESSQPEAVIDTVAQRAVAKGGSVSSRRNGFVSLQIPVAEFKAFFDYILTLGKVTGKSIFANDITDAYSDNAARLRIAEGTLARLQELLATAKTEKEKIALLKEIQRVSEQIEQRTLMEKELLRKAAFSSINLWARNIPVQAVPYRTNIRAFEWFAELPNMQPLGKALELSVPQDFIKTEDTNRKWSAASALGTEIIAFERKNNPQGTPEFWTNAVLEFFKTRFGAELKTEVIRLQTSHTEPQVYYIAILKKSDKKTLRIAVAKFPSLEAEQKNSEAIIKVLKEEK